MSDELDAIDIMLLQYPELWGNDYPNAYRDITSYGWDYDEPMINLVIERLHHQIVVKPNTNKRLF